MFKAARPKNFADTFPGNKHEKKKKKTPNKAMYSKKQNELNSQYKKRFGNFKKCTTDINNKSLSKE